MNTLDVTDGIVPRRRRFEAYRTFVMCPPALTLHFGVVISLEVFNFTNRLLKVGMSVVNGDTRFVHDRNLVRQSMGKGGQSRYLHSATSSTVSMIIPTPLIKGCPIIVLTETFGPVATMKADSSPSEVLYGRRNRKPTSSSVVTASVLFRTIPMRTMDA
jgi:hypothetical protein